MFFKTALLEWSYFFRDRAAILILVFASIFYAFYYPLPYLFEKPKGTYIGVIDFDNTALSRELLRYVQATEQIDIYKHYPDILSAKADMAGAKIFGILEIPSGFEKNIRKGENSTIGFYGHAGYFMLYSSTAKGLSLAAGTLNAGIKIKRLQAKGYSEREAKIIRDPMPSSIQTLYNNESYVNYVEPPVLMVILQQTLLIGICIMGGPRAKRKLSVKNYNKIISTHKSRSLVLRSSPNPKGCPKDGEREEASEGFRNDTEPLYIRWFARGFAYYMHYMLLFTFYTFVVYNFFSFPARAGLLTIFIFASVFIIATIQLGFLLAQLFKHRESALQIFLYLSIPFLFVSGFSWPLNMIPQELRTLFMFVPTTHAIPAWLSIQQMGASLDEVIKPITNLGILAIVYLILGCAVNFYIQKKV